MALGAISIQEGKKIMRKFLKYSIIAGGIIGAVFIIETFLGGLNITYYARPFLTIVCLGWLLVFIILALIWFRRLIDDREDQN